MCSACRALVVFCAALSAIACGSQSASPAVAVAPPHLDRPIGPLAGLAKGNEPETVNPFSENVVALGEGRRFFLSYNCAGCHGDHGGGGMGPSLRDSSWIYGGSDAQIADSIAEGRAFGMPAWAKMLTPAQIWQLTAYIKSLRSPHEPSPPL